MAAKRKRKMKTTRQSVIEALEVEPPLIDDVHRDEIEHHYTGRDPIRKTLLNTLKMSGADLLELSRNGTLGDVRCFAAFADDGPNYAKILRHIAELIDTASDRIRQAIEAASNATRYGSTSHSHPSSISNVWL